jgi:hypothetical protein
VTISAPRQRLPLFVRAGSLLPMGLVLQHIPDDHHFNHLEINAWPPFNNKLDFTDDDGRTRAYQRGEFSVTHMSIQTSVDTIHFTVEPTIGGYAGQPPVRELTLAMHALQAAPKTVLIDQQPAVDWQFDPTTHILSIPFSCPLSQTTEVVIQ